MKPNKPPAVAIIMTPKGPPKGGDDMEHEEPSEGIGADLPKEFLGDEHFNVLKPGDTGEIKFRFKVVEKSDDSVALDFIKAEDVDTETHGHGESYEDDDEGEEGEGGMRSRFKAFKETEDEK